MSQSCIHLGFQIKKNMVGSRLERHHVRSTIIFEYSYIQDQTNNDLFVAGPLPSTTSLSSWWLACRLRLHMVSCIARDSLYCIRVWSESHRNSVYIIPPPRITNSPPRHRPVRRYPPMASMPLLLATRSCCFSQSEKTL